MTALTPDDLARIEELAEKATPGPWVVNIAGELRAPTPYNGIMLARAWANGADGPDAQFIAAARVSVPALVAAVRSRDERITELEAHRTHRSVLPGSGSTPHATAGKQQVKEAGMSDRDAELQFMLDVTTVGEIIGYRPPGDDNEYDDARRIVRSDWLARVKREAAAEALEEVATDLDVHFQDLPSWTESYKAGERSTDWMKGSTRMIRDSIGRLHSRAAEIRKATP